MNTPWSWELILGVTPRLPRFVLAPLRHVTSFACLVFMPRERAAARRNLTRVTGRGGVRSLLLAYRLFHNFSRFMTTYSAMRSFDPEKEAERLLGSAEAKDTIDAVLERGEGAVIVTMHMGHWDLGLRLLGRCQLPIHVVMLTEEPAEVARYAEEARAMPNLRVHSMGRTPLVAVELMAALKRGEVVAVQLDRAVGENVLPTRFFGAETPLPTGPVQLSMATGAPILPVFVLFDTADRYRVLALPPMRFERRRGEKDSIADAMSELATMMESVVSRYPDQWFNFFDVWPDRAGGAPHD